MQGIYNLSLPSRKLAWKQEIRHFSWFALKTYVDFTEREGNWGTERDIHQPRANLLGIRKD